MLDEASGSGVVISRGGWACALVSACLLATASARAQPDTDALLQRQEELLRQWRQKQETEPDVRMQAATGHLPKRLPTNETPCAEVRQVRVNAGGLPFDEAALLGPDRSDSPAGRCLGSKGIELLVARAQDALIGQGYVTTRVSALAQDLKDGVLVLTAMPGRVARVRTPGADGEHVWKGPPLLIRPGAVLDLRDLEQSLENLQRTPGAEVNLQIVPADLDGHSDVVVDYQLERPLRAQFTLDDAGSRDTGQWQLNATLSWASPLGMADLLYVSQGKDVGGRTAGPRGSHQQVLHYSVPMGNWLLATTASDYRHHQTFAGPWVPNLYEGEGSQHEVKLARMLQRGMASKTSANIKAFARRSRNFINDAEVFPQRRKVGGWEAGLEHTHHQGTATVLLSLSHRRGTGAFGAMPAPEDRFGEGTSRMRLTQASLSLERPLRWGSQTWRYQGQLRVQWNHTPLTPQDRFCIGGRYTVRGFDGAQSLCAERGQNWRQELVWAPSDARWRPYAALDLGRVSGPSAPPRAVLAGWALGVRGAWARGALTADIDLFVGRPISHPQGFETASTTAGVSLNLGF